MTRTVRLGISTCPNDTFAFHGLLSGAIEVPGLELEVELHDVQELNEALAAGEYDVAKGSFFAAFRLASELCVLPSGSALGFGNGPLLLAPAAPRPAGAPRRVLGPGRWTTAHLLFRLFHPEEPEVEQVVFSEVMPALERGEADLGICIHEGRFTHAERGLVRVEDLGERWHAETGMALPLGGIFARRSLGVPVLHAVQDAIARSLAFARAHPDEALVSMRAHAQEQTDEVLRAHVELYVNGQTERLDAAGAAAIARLEDEARRLGLASSDGPRLAVLGEGGPA
jgi:1,4-dihydroxy-6-naphthoate synthase